jgi:alcohol dehydrogenase, propanol-preferring
METMTAFRLLEWGRPPELVPVPVPTPAVGEVLVEVTAVGLCHTDLHFMEAAPGTFTFPVPFTLGHEIAGRVADVGQGVSGMVAGDGVVVAEGPRCWRCVACLRGEDNLCAQRSAGRGWGLDGGLTRFVSVSSREVVPLQSLDPIAAAPLSDAGVTAYHAVRRIAPRLRARSTAVVIGVGGLGGFAVQILRQLTPSRVVAIDARADRLTVGRRLGAAETLLAADASPAALRELTDGEGADAVLDFVGTQATMDLSLQTARPGGGIAIVGAGGGTASIGWGLLPHDCDLFIPLGGTTADLHDVVALAQAGRVGIDVDPFPFTAVADAYARVRDGSVRGRAVVTGPM